MRIIVDVMGGDNAPSETLKGACAAAVHCDAQLVLVGKRDEIQKCADQYALSLEKMEIIHAGEMIAMGDHPLLSIQRKKDSSMVVALNHLAQGGGDALVSAGNTGALFSGATLIVGRAEGIKRAAIGTILPGEKPCLLLDAGANVSVTAEYLEQFAEIGSAYMRKMYGIVRPAVGLLNNGTEDGKGTSLQIEAGKRLKASGTVNYIGNVEASALLAGVCDVAVCDGFTGNIFLKATEGMGKQALIALRDLYSRNWLSKISYLAVQKNVSLLRKRFDASEYGGSPILGISRPVVKAHGSSDAYAFENAILQAVRLIEVGNFA